MFPMISIQNSCPLAHSIKLLSKVHSTPLTITQSSPLSVCPLLSLGARRGRGRGVASRPRHSVYVNPGQSAQDCGSARRFLATPLSATLAKYSKVDEIQGFLCFGHPNWTICSMLSCICSKKFPTFSLSYWRANSYYPREGKAENGKIEFSQPV